MPDQNNARFQDLSKFTNPVGFRGKSAIFVQLWWICQALLIHPSPQILFGWRRVILRIFGAKIGPGVLIRPSVRIVYPWKVTIGANSWIGDDVDLYSLGEIESETTWSSPREHTFARDRTIIRRAIFRSLPGRYSLNPRLGLRLDALSRQEFGSDVARWCKHVLL